MNCIGHSCNVQPHVQSRDWIDQTRNVPCCLFTTNENLVMDSPTAEVGFDETLRSARYRSQFQQEGNAFTTSSTSSPTMKDFKEKLDFDWPNWSSRTAIEDESASLPVPLATHLTPPDTGTTASFFSDSSSSPGLSPKLLSPRLCFPTKRLGHSGIRWPQPSQIVIPAPPAIPLPWIWQCHICKSTYPLSATRRCLIDGHYYCSGQPSSPQMDSAKRRRKDTQGCVSEFDYGGWEEWTTWKRKVLALNAYSQAPIDKEGIVRVSNPMVKGCEGCSFPSQCRYEWRGQEEEIEIVQHIDHVDLYETEDLSQAATNAFVESAAVEEDQAPEVKHIDRTKAKKRSKNVLGLQIDVSFYGMGKKTNNGGRFSSNHAGDRLVPYSSSNRDVTWPWYQTKHGIEDPLRAHAPTSDVGPAELKTQGQIVRCAQPQRILTPPPILESSCRQRRNSNREAPPLLSLREKGLWRWKRKQISNDETRSDNTALPPTEATLEGQSWLETEGICVVFAESDNGGNKK